MYKTLGFRWLLESFCPASAFVSADSDEARNPQRFIHVTVMGNLKKTMQMRQIIGMILIILFFSCARIENREWKYQDGFSIGDWIEFDDVGLTIRNDTIFNK